jgi:hypothetical protein
LCEHSGHSTRHDLTPPSGVAKYSTQSHATLRSYKTTICHRDANLIIEVLRLYIHYFLKIPIKYATTLPWRRLPYPTHWPVITGCYTSQHPKAVEQDSRGTSDHIHGLHLIGFATSLRIPTRCRHSPRFRLQHQPLRGLPRTLSLLSVLSARSASVSFLPSANVSQAQ